MPKEVKGESEQIEHKPWRTCKVANSLAWQVFVQSVSPRLVG